MNRVSAAVAPPSRSIAFRLITSKYSPNHDRSWPPNASPNSLTHGLQVHLWVPRFWSPRSSPKSLYLGLQVHLWVTRSQPPCASPNPLDHSLQVYLGVQLHLSLQVNLETCSITASKCISELHDLGIQMNLQTHLITSSKCITESLDLGLQMHLQTPLIMASKCISELLDLSLQCISKPARSQPPSASLSSTQSRPPSVSPNSLDCGLQIHLPVYTITASKCISKFSQSASPGAPSITL